MFTCQMETLLPGEELYHFTQSSLVHLALSIEHYEDRDNYEQQKVRKNGHYVLQTPSTTRRPLKRKKNLRGAPLERKNVKSMEGRMNEARRKNHRASKIE